MKKFVLLALLMSTVLSASAQWVEIPDANFANKLNELFPECMDGNQMDTTCSAITSETDLDVGFHDITDLTGLQYFINLEELDCEWNDLVTLPELPSSLTWLKCNGNGLIELPELPGSLTELYCHGNNLTVLPELPGSLTYLRCSANNLTELPNLPGSLTELNCSLNSLVLLPQLPVSLITLFCRNSELIELPVLPASLTHLYCDENNLTVLPELPGSLVLLHCRENNLIELPELPETLTELYCYINELTQLPELPGSLIELICYSNDLTELPDLPASLTFLECRNNDLNELPDLPNSITHLECDNNNLTTLPPLPGSLLLLNCFDNNLTILPALPTSLSTLRCQNNQLTCLPPLPFSLNSGSIWDFDISINLFTCLPNYVNAMSGQDNSVWMTYPLCDLSDTVNNPYGCNSPEGIAGTVYEDENVNCEKDESENGLTNIPLQLLDSDSNLLASTFTLSDKIYNFAADTGTYYIQLVTQNQPYQISCAVPGASQEVILTESDTAALDVDFGVECLPEFDFGTQSIATTGWVFPGQEHKLRISAGDLSSWYGLQCANGVSGTVIVNINGSVSYVQPAENALSPILSGDVQLTYDIADFGSVNFEESFNIILETNTTAQAGDLVCVEVIVDPIDDDANPANNTYTHCYSIGNSYDPNIKQVWPHNVEPGYDGYFNYTIYFQNTGTAPAFNIRVADTLDTNLDLSTFEVTAYSHPCLTYVEGDVATFRFNNIMLPDSTSDFEGSIGYVQYRIKPISDLPVGTIIENTAHIFFDFNDAIVTNTTQNEFVITTSTNELQKQLATVFPNPGTGQFNVLFNNIETGIITDLEVYNLNGQRVLQQQVNENRITLDLTNYPSGMYLLHVRNEQGSEAVKLMKQ